MVIQTGQKQQVLLATVRKLLRRGAVQNLANLLQKSRPAEIAFLFPQLADQESQDLFRTCLAADVSLAAEVVSEMDANLSRPLIESLPLEQLQALLAELPPDDAADLVGLLPEDVGSHILSQSRTEESRTVEDLLTYAPDSAGGIMSSDVFAMSEGSTAAETIDALQQQTDAEMVFYVYCVNDNHQLTGVLSLRQLLTVPRDRHLSQIMSREVIFVHTSMDQEEVARVVARYNLLAVPVVDDFNHLVGLVTVDDAIDVIREEATEDFLKLAGAAEDDILSRSILRSVSARLPWLAASFLGGLVASEVIEGFDSALKTMGVLAGFIPVITGMGGNVGTQASTLVVRGIATGKIDPRNIAWYLYKEMRVGALMGLTYGLILGLFVSLRYGESMQLGLAIGGSICLSMFAAATWGSLVPMVLSRLHVDPAVATGPFVTTSLDIFGIVIYFTLATHLLGIA